MIGDNNTISTLDRAWRFTTMSNDRSSQINWREWTDDILKIAESEDKLILLDLRATWCHWCHVMDRTTYSNAEVVSIVNQRFIPVRVDADKRPDIEDKYLLGGWPTTAFLVPDGEILTGSTYIPPEAMLNKLREVDAMYHEHKSIVAKHVTSMAAEAEYDRSLTETAAGTLDDKIISEIISTVKKAYDPEYGGFAKEPKFPYPEAVHFAFLEYRKTGDKEMREMALKTLDGMLGIYDPVWGGFYRYSMSRDWSQPHYEKLLNVQAGAMNTYLEAYQVTGDDKYGEVAAGIKAYITKFLADNDNGGFYGNQDADINSHDPTKELIPGDHYFSKSEDERLSMGIPYVDKTIYADANGMMASAYFRMYQVMGDEHALDFAVKTIDRILEYNAGADDMCHYLDGRDLRLGLLTDQVHFSQALVDAYQTTGQRSYLTQAENLVSFMIVNLQDVVDGGFYLQSFNPHARGTHLERHKPFDENVSAALLLSQLYYLTGYETYRDLAARTLRATCYPQITESVIGVGYGTALDLYVNPPMHIVVVGDKENEKTTDMLETSLHAYEPSKLVQVLDPTEENTTIGELTYMAEEEPLAYVCVQNVCTPPARGNTELATILEDVLTDNE